MGCCNETQVVRLGGEHLYPLSPLTLYLIKHEVPWSNYFYSLTDLWVVNSKYPCEAVLYIFILLLVIKSLALCWAYTKHTKVLSHSQLLWRQLSFKEGTLPYLSSMLSGVPGVVPDTPSHENTASLALSSQILLSTNLKSFYQSSPKSGAIYVTPGLKEIYWFEWCKWLGLT